MRHPAAPTAARGRRARVSRPPPLSPLLVLGSGSRMTPTATGPQRPAGGRPVVGSPISVGDSPSAVAASAGSVWVANSGEGRSAASTSAPEARRASDCGRRGPRRGRGRSRLGLGGELRRRDAHQDRSALQSALGGPIAVGRGPTDVAVGRGRVWVATELDGVVTVDARTGRLRGAPIRVRSAGSLALAGDVLWVADELDGTLRAVDTRPEHHRGSGSDRRQPDGSCRRPDQLWVSVAGERAIKR